MTAEERVRERLSRWEKDFHADLDAAVIALLRDHEAEVRTAEQERCAQIAERDAEFFPEEDNASLRVAAAIRATRTREPCGHRGPCAFLEPGAFPAQPDQPGAALRHLRVRCEALAERVRLGLLTQEPRP